MQLTSNTKINFSLPLSLPTRVTTKWLKQPIFLFCKVAPGQSTACICESHVPFGNRKCCHQNGNNSTPRSHVNSTYYPINKPASSTTSINGGGTHHSKISTNTHYPAPLAIACPLKAALSSIATQPSPTPTTSKHPPAMPGVSFMGDAFYPLPEPLWEWILNLAFVNMANLEPETWLFENTTHQCLKECKEPTTDMLVWVQCFNMMVAVLSVIPTVHTAGLLCISHKTHTHTHCNIFLTHLGIVLT